MGLILRKFIVQVKLAISCPKQHKSPKMADLKITFNKLLCYLSICLFSKHLLLPLGSVHLIWLISNALNTRIVDIFPDFDSRCLAIALFLITILHSCCLARSNFLPFQKKILSTKGTNGTIKYFLTLKCVNKLCIIHS